MIPNSELDRERDGSEVTAAEKEAIEMEIERDGSEVTAAEKEAIEMEIEESYEELEELKRSCSNKSSTFMFELGQKVRDAYTPFKGMVFARTEYLEDTSMYGIITNTLENNKPVSLVWLEESRLRLD